jgi:hypothetical protein
MKLKGRSSLAGAGKIYASAASSFHGGNTGSIPVGRANDFKHLSSERRSFTPSYGTDIAAPSISFPVAPLFR